MPADEGQARRLAEARLRVIAMHRMVDLATVDVVALLRSAGVDPILLKGPAVATWLYASDPVERPYHDVDLLVGPQDWAAARQALLAGGYEQTALDPRPRGAPAPHAETWVPEGGGVEVDLHRTIHSLEHLDPALVWREAQVGTVPLPVRSVVVRVPSPAFRTLHTAVHLQPRDHAGTRPWIDLERAIATVDEATWADAAALAERLDAATVLRFHLERVPSGAALADRLGLEAGVPERVAEPFERRSLPPGPRFLRRLRELPLRDSLGRLRAKVLPRPEDLRTSWPLARRGPAGLVAVYAWRIALIPSRLWSDRRARRG